MDNYLSRPFGVWSIIIYVKQRKTYDAYTQTTCRESLIILATVVKKMKRDRGWYQWSFTKTVQPEGPVRG